MAVGDAAFYTYINSGATLTAQGDARFSIHLNAGATLVASQNTTLLSVFNAGVAPPTVQTIVRGVQGWGVHVQGPMSINITLDSSDATTYTYEGDVTS